MEINYSYLQERGMWDGHHAPPGEHGMDSDGAHLRPESMGMASGPYPGTVIHPGTAHTAHVQCPTVWHPCHAPSPESIRYENPFAQGYSSELCSPTNFSVMLGDPQSICGGGMQAQHSDGRRKRRRVITTEQRSAANIRERRRMYHLNEAFDLLRKRVPTFAYEKKLSRIETLKLAVTYIQFMTDTVDTKGLVIKKSAKKGKKSTPKESTIASPETDVVGLLTELSDTEKDDSGHGSDLEMGPDEEVLSVEGHDHMDQDSLDQGVNLETDKENCDTSL